MRLSLKEFDRKIAYNDLTITFVGMSGIGKTHCAEQFASLGFRHACCDDLIAYAIGSGTTLKNVTDVGVWMGQPYTNGYRDRERQYLEIEENVTKDILEKAHGKTVIDSTGSVIYLSQKTLQALRKKSLIVYFEANPEMYKQMLEVYLNDPKPVIWGSVFKPKEGESQQATLERCYPLLLHYRAEKYKELADITIPHAVLKESWWDPERFLEVVREYAGQSGRGAQGGKEALTSPSSPGSIGQIMHGKVLKFGGTSVGSADAIKKVINIVRKPHQDSKPVAVIVSAMGGVTDQLIAIATSASKKDLSYKKSLKQLEARHIATTKALVRDHQKAALLDVKILLESLHRMVEGVSMIEEVSPRVLDHVMSYGERLSATMLTYALKDRGIACEYLDASTVIATDDRFGEASVDFLKTNQKLRAYFAAHQKLQVVTGFIGSSPNGEITTLGRGGSDYSASIISAALGVQSIEIWTDVSGVLTADPRKVKNTLPISSMTYQEASEMSFFGARVIHPPTMMPARKKGIPIYIKNTFDSEAPGTTISKVSKEAHSGAESEQLAKGITSISNVSMLRVEGAGMVGTRGSASRIFGALAKARVNVILITQASSEYSISVAVAPKDAETAREAIDEEFTLEHHNYRVDPVVVEHDFSILAVVGERMRHKSGIAGRLFSALGKNHINVVAVAQGSSELIVSVVIRQSDEIRALNVIHEAFFYPQIKHINIFQIGTGLIGSMLLQQIATQSKRLEIEQGYVMRLIGVAHSDGMVLDENGIDPANWKGALKRAKTKTDVEGFVERMKALNVPDSVFVDCTGSDDVALQYADILGSGIAIVTPNKKANSGTLAYYRRLKKIAAEQRTRFFYETTVGAGLPVISTLHDLLLSGDRVHTIAAIPSGTLSYIFNTFTGEKPFSTVVREAKDRGYTETDPRDDLRGIDVARKILILGREIGLPLELKDIHVESLVSPSALKAKTVEEFFKLLKKEDVAFEKKRKEAEREGKHLRYIAQLHEDKAAVSLQAVDPSHPFYKLQGNDNIIAFTTDRYRKTPLVIQGPGAGAEVTAAGVFADILRTTRETI